MAYTNHRLRSSYNTIPYVTSPTQILMRNVPSCQLCYKSVSSLRVHYYRKHRADIDVRCQVEDKDNQDSVSVVSSTGNEDTEDKNKKNKAL